MTALIAVVEAGVGYLAVDQQHTLGNSSTTNSKIVQHPRFERIAFAAAGEPMIAYPATLIDPPFDGDTITAPGPAWADRYWRRMLELGHPPVDPDTHGQIDGNLLVLTPGAVTLIGGTGWPSPIGPRGIALGSAGDFALGAYHAYRDADPGLPVAEALHRSIFVACGLSHTADPPVDVVSL